MPNLQDDCMRIFSAYKALKLHLPPGMKAYWQVSLKTSRELDRLPTERYQTLCGLPVKVDIADNAKDVLLIMEA